MSETKKSWPKLGYIKDSEDTPLDGFLQLDKNLTIEIDGEAIETKSLAMPKYLTVYDKASKQELIVGKLVKKRKEFRNENSELQVFIALEPNVTFKVNGDKVATSGFASLESSGSQKAKLDKDLADGKITEGQYDESLKYTTYSKAVVTLPPPRN